MCLIPARERNANIFALQEYILATWQIRWVHDIILLQDAKGLMQFDIHTTCQSYTTHNSTHSRKHIYIPFIHILQIHIKIRDAGRGFLSKRPDQRTIPRLNFIDARQKTESSHRKGGRRRHKAIGKILVSRRDCLSYAPPPTSTCDRLRQTESTIHVFHSALYWVNPTVKNEERLGKKISSKIFVTIYN